MNADRWTQIERILDAYFDHEKEDADPEELLLDLCDGDEALRDEVSALLDAESDVDAVLERDAASLAAPIAEEIVAEEFPDEDAAGARIGPYELEEEIGRGGMSVVYRGRRVDGQFDREVAIKLLPRAFSSERRIARFRAERQILAQLKHRSIASMLDGGVTESGRPFLAMELVEGVPITAYCDENDCSVEERLAMFEDVCRAVEHAHRRLVVHRDLKPGNILVAETADGPVVKLLDFGIAKLLDEDEAEWTAPVTRTGEYLMTPQYAAPEQVRGEAITTATDVYQLGVLLFELLAGVRPFRIEGRSLTEIERVILRTDPDPLPDAAKRAGRPDEVIRSLRGDLQTIVGKAMRKEPDRRYPSVEALRTDIRRSQTGLPIEARPLTFGYRTRKFVRRNRPVVIGGALVLVLLIVYLATVTVQRQRIAEERDRVRMEAQTSEAVTEYLVDLFRATDPNRAATNPPTAPELLDDGLGRIDALDDQPRVQTRLLRVMALAYQNLGEYPTADSLLNIAVQTQEATLDPRDPELAITYRVQGGLRMHQGAYAEAESLLVRSVDILSDDAPAGAELVLALDRLADAQTALNQNEEAKTNYRRALSTEETLPPTERVQRSSILHGLGILYGEEDDFVPAESLLTESLRLHRERPNVRPLTLARVMSSLSVIHMKQQELDEAETLLREALSLKRERLDPGHPRLASTINNLAVCLERKKKYDEAESLYRETIEILRANHGDVHPGIASTLSNIASLSMRRGDFQQAEQRYRDVLAMDRQLLPPGHFYIGNDHMRIGQAMARQNQFVEAETEILKGWEMIEASLDSGAPALDRARSQVKEFYEAWGRPDEAAGFETPPDTTSATTGD
ncbi:tetratricopeptide repeat protein [Longibacter sp.]|uniref:tetratricopeptide repeat protein n=1 Tax=Longibacter sp. TaxID=2045415 RepID=UPI003EC00F65